MPRQSVRSHSAVLMSPSSQDSMNSTSSRRRSLLLEQTHSFSGSFSPEHRHQSEGSPPTARRTVSSVPADVSGHSSKLSKESSSSLSSLSTSSLLSLQSSISLPSPGNSMAHGAAAPRLTWRLKVGFSTYGAATFRNAEKEVIVNLNRLVRGRKRILAGEHLTYTLEWTSYIKCNIGTKDKKMMWNISGSSSYGPWEVHRLEGRTRVKDLQVTTWGSVNNWSGNFLIVSKDNTVLVDVECPDQLKYVCRIHEAVSTPQQLALFAALLVYVDKALEEVHPDRDKVRGNIFCTT
eukprot:TRINITY_DN1247_c1_g1_i1.p1 TRINITY_DN1247_c1_g1~~TRINITY_DN1247_c1_g1_i1.p1  ORF type:complete len:326 (+),score=52.85 TRINITY_DN1247_c1_g1_i1:103-978(+)